MLGFVCWWTDDVCKYGKRSFWQHPISVISKVSFCILSIFFVKLKLECLFLECIGKSNKNQGKIPIKLKSKLINDFAANFLRQINSICTFNTLVNKIFPSNHHLQIAFKKSKCSKNKQFFVKSF